LPAAHRFGTGVEVLPSDLPINLEHVVNLLIDVFCLKFSDITVIASYILLHLAAWQVVMLLIEVVILILRAFALLPFRQVILLLDSIHSLPELLQFLRLKSNKVLIMLFLHLLCDLLLSQCLHFVLLLLN
jgi:hypothetical protein